MKPKKELNIQIGNRVKKAREKSGLTQEQFAEMIDKTPQFISDLERGISGISIETLKTICEKLFISSDSLLFPEQIQNDPSELFSKLQRMPPSLFHGVEQITNAYLHAIHTVKTDIKESNNSEIQ